MAPLHDSRGGIRYFIGAQIDISHLLEDGRGLESFKQLLDQDEESLDKVKHAEPQLVHLEHKPSMALLSELGSLLNDEEIEAIKNRDREGHLHVLGRRTSVCSGNSATTAPVGQRRYVGMEDSDDNIWPPSIFGPNGRLPGVYQNVRNSKDP